MLYQKKSGRAARLKYLLTLPLICGLLCLSTLAFTTKNYGVVDLVPKHIVNEVEKPTAISRSTPSFPGGAQALHKFLNDHIDRSKVESGAIVNHLFLTFRVEKDGSVSNLEIKRSPKGEFKPETVAEITRILNNGPKWIPATRNGEAVSSRSFVVFDFKDGVGSESVATEETSISKTDNNRVVFNAVEKNPSFPGNEDGFDKFLAKNIKYPQTARDNNISGKVFLQFIVEPTGSLSNIKILREPGYGTGAEALRVLKLSPKWKSGEQNGRKVRVMYTVPVNFSLAPSDKKDATTSAPDPDSVYRAVEINPKFPGGEAAFGKFLRDNIRYPRVAKENNVQGKTFTQFIVEKDGSLSNFKVVRDPGTGLGAESMRVLGLSPKWTPGINKGEVVRVQYIVPINFSLADGDGLKDTKAFYKYILDHVRYPAIAKERNIQGQSLINFTVDANKNIQNIEVLKSPDKLLSDEITRVVAGFKTFADGKADVTYTIPVTYSINNGSAKIASAVNPSPVANRSNLKNTEKVMLNEVTVVGYGPRN